MILKNKALENAGILSKREIIVLSMHNLSSSNASNWSPLPGGSGERVRLMTWWL